MKIIEIAAQDNGAHRNQFGGISTIPEGWAQIPYDMELPDTFPFVSIELDETGKIVSAMTPGVVPEPEPEPEPEPTDTEVLNALLGVTV